MADILSELNTIENDWMGHEIRFPIHDAIEKINKQLDEQDAGIEDDGEASANA